MDDFQKQAYDQLLKSASDKGLVLELGCLAMLACFKPSPEQVGDMRLAYFAGAQHLFATMMTIMDSDREPTPQDMVRMSKIDAEISLAEQALKLRGMSVKGHA